MKKNVPIYTYFLLFLTIDVKKAIALNDILVVSREDQKNEQTEVGKIKVLSYAGEDYIKGVVAEGQVRTGDIAKKDHVASLVISSNNNL